MKKSKFIIVAVALLLALLMISILHSFSILSNSSGYARRYLDSDIPFSYQLNNSTPSDYFNSIHAGAQSWEDVISSYWEFDYGGLTPANTDNFDGVNLVFFDFQGVNFPVGTNAIAYSRTWTSGSGSGFHALESDLIWNARDFPPSPTGAAGQQDLQSVIAHEFGHHLALGHAGPAGSPPGVGPLIPEATMYGFSSAGDTTHRSLHIDDIAGVSAIYPVWKLEGTVTYAGSGLPFEGIGITSNTVYASVVGPVEFNDTWQRPGYFEDVVTTGVTGHYSAVILKQQVDLTVKYFGYQNQETPVSFNPPGGIGSTETITMDFQMQASPLATISGIVVDSLTGLPVNAQIAVWAISDKPGTPQGIFADTTTGASGDYSLELVSEEDYRIVVTPEAPYPEKTFIVEELSVGGITLNVNLVPADLMLVNDDLSLDYDTFYQNSLESLGLTYHKWHVSEKGVPDSSVYASFPSPRTIIWYTGDANATVLTADEQQSIAGHLDMGGRLLLTGQNIAETSSGGVLLSNYLGVTFNINIVPPIIRGVAGDPIGDGLILSSVGGAGNQISKDAMLITGNADSMCYYGTTTSLGIAGVRVEDSQAGWKAVFLGFGVEGLNNTDGMRDTLTQRILNWFDVLTGIEVEPVSLTGLPEHFELRRNYPNPFNPQTTIEFAVSEATDVRIQIFNSLGQKIATLVDKRFAPGTYRTIWEGSDDSGHRVSSGIYFCRMSAMTGFARVQKLLFVK